MDLMWFLVLAHLVGDYGLQSDWMAEHKRTSVAVLAIHVLIYTVTIGVALALYGSITQSYAFWRFWVIATLVIVYAVHVAQDYLKSRYFHSRQAYYIDQILHISALFAIRLLIVS
ncbi:MAG: DUF3307 domain-containing protein [candidate division Zixibacteria bacterium]|nr:DUF3307 domain-containing protein [candidate division Zixibacteria bacterium]